MFSVPRLLDHWWTANARMENKQHDRGCMVRSPDAHQRVKGCSLGSNERWYGIAVKTLDKLSPIRCIWAISARSPRLLAVSTLKQALRYREFPAI